MAVLAYWKLRGLAQPARLLLNYVGEEFEDKFFEFGPAPDFDRSSWTDIKWSLGLDFPNLPYYIDGDIKITQSNAILRYIARKHGLCGSTDLERARVDMMADEAMDFRNDLVRLCYNPKADDMLSDYLEQLPRKLKSFNTFIGDRKFFAADSVTFVDFVMYELLDQHRVLFKDSLKEYSKLNDFLDRIEALPAIKKYMESEKFMKSPMNGKMARYGNN